MKLKSIKYDYQKGQIDQFTGIESPVQTRVESKSENLDPIPSSDINNDKIEINTGKIERILSRNQNMYLSAYFRNGMLESTHLTKFHPRKFNKRKMKT